MSLYNIGKTIQTLRKSKNMTQSDLANQLCVSNKTISKWETKKGYPDICILDKIAKVFEISLDELVSGYTINNRNINSNMLRTHFYICPICGNVIYSVGEALISCHGITVKPCEIQKTDDNHNLMIENVEDEYFVTSYHDMSKEHYISFVAAISQDRVQFIKLYPESSMQIRINRRGVRKIYFYCNKDGLYLYNMKR